MLRGSILLAALAGCTDDHCIEGTCPDPGETRALPGPCSSRNNDSIFGPITYEYDDAQRVTHVEVRTDNGEDAPDRIATTWTYQGDRLVSVGHRQWEATSRTWTLGDDAVTESDRVYDPTRFAFLPLVGNNRLWPQAELGLLRDHARTYTWTSEGRHLVRRSVPTTEHPETRVLDVELDARDRIVAMQHDGDGDGVVDRVDRYAYDGDLLVHVVRIGVPLPFPGEMDYVYDAGGNVIEGRSVSGQDRPFVYREVYDYSCW